MVGGAELRHNDPMRFAFVLVLAGCGVQIGGDTNTTDGSTDTQRPVDAAIDSPDARPCTGGDMAMQSGGSCYLLFTGTPRTWADANTACTSMGTRLAILDTAAKHTAAKTLAGARDVWIGLTDIAAEGTYRWVDVNVPFVFSMWHMGEPSNGAGTYEEDCTVIAGATARDWDDRPCSDAVAGAPAGCCSYAYMCQF
jgi:hypothetical protein